MIFSADLHIALETEIVKARMSGKSVIIEIDSNSKLGSQYIPNDPHPISPNGKMLARVINTHALIVANSLTRCTLYYRVNNQDTNHKR